MADDLPALEEARASARYAEVHECDGARRNAEYAGLIPPSAAFSYIGNDGIVYKAVEIRYWTLWIDYDSISVDYCPWCGEKLDISGVPQEA